MTIAVDGVIEQEAIRVRCRQIATFDRGFAALIGDLAFVPE